MKKRDMIPLVVTFIFCLYETSIGIIFGIFTHLVILLGMHLYPIKSKSYGDSATLAFNGNILFPSQEVLNRFPYISVRPKGAHLSPYHSQPFTHKRSLIG